MSFIYSQCGKKFYTTRFSPCGMMTRCALTLCACLLAVEASAATVELRAPLSADTGAAFLAEARTDAAGDKVVFHWRGKEYAVPLEAEKTASSPSAQPAASVASPAPSSAPSAQSASSVPSSASSAAPSVLPTSASASAWRTARLLLPVPLDEGKTSLPLTVRAGTDGGSARAEQAVQVRRKPRPEQRLNVEPKYVAPPAGERERIKQERALVLAALAGYSGERLWALPFVRPVSGAPSSLFGLKRIFNGEPRGEHKGLDLRGAAGTPVHALADGRVVLARSLYYAGNAVYVDHGLGVFSAYMHLSAFAVQAGQRVRRGEVLGQVGATGRVTGPHLHVSLYAQGCAVDPESLLEARQEKNHAQK